MHYNKLLNLFFLLLIIFTLSCQLVIPPEKQVEDWIAMIDADGNNLQFICRDITSPYFIPDPDNPGEEIILLDGGRVDVMDQDGSNRRTIIDSVGGIYRFSEDRSRMLLAKNGEIYIANTDGSGLENLTNTPDRIEDQPSFSQNCEKVIYHYSDFEDSISVIACIEIATGLTCNIYEEVFGYNFTYFKSPVFIDSSTIIFGQNYSGSDSLNIEGLFLFDGENKILIDPGSISTTISYNRNANLLAYVISTSLKLYHIDTGVFDIMKGNYGYNVPAYFNRDGSLLTFKSYVIDTSTLEGYNILRYYDDDANIDSNPIDFNETSTKAIMKVSRIFPNSNEVGRL